MAVNSNRRVRRFRNYIFGPVEARPLEVPAAPLRDTAGALARDGVRFAARGGAAGVLA